MRKIYDRIVFSPDEPTGGSEDPMVDDDVAGDLASFLDDSPVEPVADPIEPDPVEPVTVEPVVESPPEPVAPTPSAEPQVVEPVAPQPVDRVTELEALLAKQAELIERLAGGSPAKSVADPVQVPSVPDTPAAPIEATPSLDLNQILQDMDFDEVMESKESFLKFMGNLMTVQREITKKEVLSTVPSTVENYYNRTSTMQEVAKEFYSKHPVLERFKKFVGVTATEVSAENPDKLLPEILELTAARVKETLGLKDTALASPSVSTDKKAPVLPGSSGAPRAKPAPTNALLDEISELIND